MPENPYQSPGTEECLEKEPPSAGLIADLLDALPPPVLKRLLVILLWFYGVQLAIVLVLRQAVLYLLG